MTILREIGVKKPKKKAYDRPLNRQKHQKTGRYGNLDPHSPKGTAISLHDVQKPEISALNQSNLGPNLHF